MVTLQLRPRRAHWFTPLRSLSALTARTFVSKQAAATERLQDSNEDLAAARKWLTGLTSKTIPRHICEISFSRSGGPGGQNVNKSVDLA